MGLLQVSYLFQEFHQSVALTLHDYAVNARDCGSTDVAEWLEEGAELAQDRADAVMASNMNGNFFDNIRYASYL